MIKDVAWILLLSFLGSGIISVSNGQRFPLIPPRRRCPPHNPLPVNNTRDFQECRAQIAAARDIKDPNASKRTVWKWQDFVSYESIEKVHYSPHNWNGLKAVLNMNFAFTEPNHCWTRLLVKNIQFNYIRWIHFNVLADYWRRDISSVLW